MKKKMETSTLQRLGVLDVASRYTYYEYDDPITRVKFFPSDEYRGQGDTPYCATFFSGDREIDTVELMHPESKLRVSSWYLGGDNFIGDPRITATYILLRWLYRLVWYPLTPDDPYDPTSDLQKLNYVFTREEAFEWLDKNGFTGTQEDRKRLSHEIYALTSEMKFVPHHVREIYDKYSEKFRPIISRNYQEELERNQQKEREELERKRKKEQGRLQWLKEIREKYSEGYYLVTKERVLLLVGDNKSVPGEVLVCVESKEGFETLCEDWGINPKLVDGDVGLYLGKNEGFPEDDPLLVTYEYKFSFPKHDWEELERVHKCKR